ncbi:MAG: hypothetical protein U5Q03_10825 [Bacteroidota bacterium]|nr:hypothetical protein [Bacteroidota bacterium]
MKGTTLENRPIAEKLGFDFNPEEYSLDGWGDVDFFAIENDVSILLEVEKGQKHPNTNVLKIWPYLEDNPDQKILLIQLIRPENKAPKNRIKLCKFTGRKIEEMFPNRFAYVFYHWHPDILPELKMRIDEKLKTLT